MGKATLPIAAHPNAELLVDDLTAALAYGDGVSALPPGPVTAPRLHLAAVRIWAVIVHVLNVAIRPAAEI